MLYWNLINLGLLDMIEILAIYQVLNLVESLVIIMLPLKQWILFVNNLELVLREEMT